jgi:2-oxoisovalerate dehydrogenase E1 component
MEVMDDNQLAALYRAMLTAREIDRVEQELTNRGEAFFHVAGAGHEASAALALHLNADDWLHCHYRDKALMIARGITPRSFFDSLFCKRNSHSRGRQMSAHMSDRRLNVLSIVGPVGNSALQAVGVAAAVKEGDTRPIVLCSAGDGTTQEGEFLEACAEAVRCRLPVLFFVEDNRWAISTTTAGKTFYSHPQGDAREFYGMPIHRIDGRDVLAVHEQIGHIIDRMRREREPALVVFQVERLTNHTNADDQTIYREESDILAASQTGDPIRRFEEHLLAHGFSPDTLANIQQEVTQSVAAAEAESAAGPEPLPTFTAKQPIPVELTHPSREVCGDGNGRQLTMRDAMREVLRHHLQSDPRVTLLGEDIEDPKGDVFGVTKTLSTEFPGRVTNAALSESTIVGVSAGRALAGERPVAFIQFADFLPLAYNQIVSELGSMYWRTDGQWTAPVILMAACGGYRPGLGPFHAQTFESLVAHTPGIDVFMPSTAADAAGLLNAAFQSGRPTLFFYPKSCLNDPQQTTSADVARQFVPIGPARKTRVGRDLTLVGWGNTVRLCERAASELEKAGVEAEVIDLRSLSPWDERTVLSSAEKTAHLIVVHEDNHTCGVGAEVLATVAEKTRVPVAMRRVTRPDTYVPCNFANQIEVLPSFKKVLTTAAELLDLELTWIPPPQSEEGVAYVEAIGSGPSDETVVIVELLVKQGDTIRRGDVVASLEATKSVFELTSSVAGELEEILVAEGDTVGVGAPLMKVRVEQTEQRVKPITQEQPGTPVLVHKPAAGRLRVPRRDGEPRKFDVGISSFATIEGSRLVTNADLLLPHVGRNGTGKHVMRSSGKRMTPDDIVRRTGIESRHWVSGGENAVNMAVRACWQVLDQENLLPDDLDLVICSTTSPTSVTPSMACQVLHGLTSGKTDAMLQAFDINAACSGYLYALQSGYDFLQSMPHGRVLIVTSEVLSPLLDPDDFDTAILFGDASSASILYGEAHFEQAKGRLYRPELSAKGDAGGSLSVPLLHDGYIQMKGRKVFSEAVRSMITSLTRVCQREGLAVGDLSLVVPHQANQRIIDAIQSRVGVSVFSNIRQHGNTSSTSIPLCLREVFPSVTKGDRLGLCAFGGGFTFGASILEAL